KVIDEDLYVQKYRPVHAYCCSTLITYKIANQSVVNHSLQSADSISQHRWPCDFPDRTSEWPFYDGSVIARLCHLQWRGSRRRFGQHQRGRGRRLFGGVNLRHLFGRTALRRRSPHPFLVCSIVSFSAREKTTSAAPPRRACFSTG